MRTRGTSPEAGEGGYESGGGTLAPLSSMPLGRYLHTQGNWRDGEETGQRVLACLCPQTASDECTVAAAQVDMAQLYLASFTLDHEKGTWWIMGLTYGVGGPLHSPGYDAMGYGESFSPRNRAPGPLQRTEIRERPAMAVTELPGRRWSVSLSPPAGSPASLLHHLPAQKLLGPHLHCPEAEVPTCKGPLVELQGLACTLWAPLPASSPAGF